MILNVDVTPPSAGVCKGKAAALERVERVAFAAEVQRHWPIDFPGGGWVSVGDVQDVCLMARRAQAGEA